MKILILVAIVLAIADADDDCHFDPQMACDRCPWDRSFVHFVADDCNINTFYLCERTSDGVIIPHAQHCNPCFGFSNDLWTCSIRIKDDPCPADPPADDPPPQQIPYRNFFCVDFDKDYRDKRAYYNVDPACHIVNVSEQYSPDDIHGSGLKIEKQALLSDGIPCNIEIPYFQNNEFDQFTFCGLFTFFNTTSEGDMGLVFNGEEGDCYPGSITIRLTSDRRVLAGIQTAQGNFGIINQQRLSSYSPHKVCFRYDGTHGSKFMELVVDGNVEQRNYPDDSPPKTVRQKCNLRVGEVLEIVPVFAGYRYAHRAFVGILDTWCFSPSIVDESYFTSP